MTTQHVLLAQTKIGFLTGGRGNKFQELGDIEKQSQREEAFARATVALTRAQEGFSTDKQEAKGRQRIKPEKASALTHKKPRGGKG